MVHLKKLLKSSKSSFREILRNPGLPDARRRKLKASLLLGLCLPILWTGCNKAESKSGPPSVAAIRLIMPDGKSIDPSSADVRIYPKKEFDAVLHAATDQADKTRQTLIDAVSREREDIELRLRFSKMEKEQKIRAKDTVEKMLTQTGDASYADEFRKEMHIFDSELDAIEKAIHQDQSSLNVIVRKESRAQAVSLWDLVVPAVLNELPKTHLPFQEDAGEKRKALLSRAEDYVIVTNANSKSAAKIRFYWTSAQVTEGQKPNAVPLEKYNLIADGK
jgi:hypothetical protein